MFLPFPKSDCLQKTADKPFIRLRQNTLQLVAGMNGEPNHGEARQSEDGLATS
jgi:hypothetical protein